MLKQIFNQRIYLTLIVVLIGVSHSYALISDSLDITHTTVRLEVVDYAGKTIAGNAELKITALQDNINIIPLDLQQLNVDSVISGTTSLLFDYDGLKLLIELPTTMNTGDSTTITIYYNGEPDKDLSWGGWYWSGDYSYQMGVGFDSDPHNFGRIWFPCFDNFIERSTIRFEITTLAGYKAFCAGLLESETDNGDGTTTWIWNCNQTIPSYLASVAVSTYATVEYNYEGIIETIPVQLAAKAVDTTKLKDSFVHLTDALFFFENAYGYYRWDRVGYSIVPFSGGAMEHAMNIAYPLFAVTGTTAWEDLMVHELAHSWWGNLITCAHEKEMWLNEGWAEYSVHLFNESLYGEQKYKDMVNTNHLEIIHYGYINEGGNYFALADMPHDHTYGFTTYNKGAMVAHNLRGYMGDEMFFECLKGFLHAYAFQPVSSQQFNDYLTECSGIDMFPFFEGWVFNPGMPAFELQSNGYSHMPNLYDLCIQQKRNHAPDFFGNVPLEISAVNSKGKTLYTTSVIADGENSSYSLFMPHEESFPVFFIIDRENKIADATTAQEFFITEPGDYTSDFGKINFTVNALESDTDWIRIEHYWVGADGFRSPVPGLHVNNQRYFRVIGGHDPTTVSAIIKYNGTVSTTGGYLDNEFISNVDDSLVLLYRADPQDEWEIYTYYTLDIWAISTDKRGEFELSQMHPGEYTFAIYNSAIPDAEPDINPCAWVETTIYQFESNLNIYPNPADNFIHIEIPENLVVDEIRIFNSNGILIFNEKIHSHNSDYTIETTKFPTGLYNVCVTTSAGLTSSQKLLIIR